MFSLVIDIDMHRILKKQKTSWGGTVPNSERLEANPVNINLCPPTVYKNVQPRDQHNSR